MRARAVAVMLFGLVAGAAAVVLAPVAWEASKDLRRRIVYRLGRD